MTDGAGWLQSFIDLHRPDAQRILDFPHAAERVGLLIDALKQTEVYLPSVLWSAACISSSIVGLVCFCSGVNACQQRWKALEEVQKQLNCTQTRSADAVPRVSTARMAHWFWDGMEWGECQSSGGAVPSQRSGHALSYRAR